MKEMFIHWEENVATDEELELLFDEQYKIFTSWYAGRCDHAYESIKDHMMFNGGPPILSRDS